MPVSRKIRATPPPSGAAAAPTLLLPGEVFTVAARTQVLYSQDIVNQGDLVIEGDLVRVD